MLPLPTVKSANKPSFASASAPTAGEMEKENAVAIAASKDGGGSEEATDVYARFYSCRQCWASKCRGL